MRNIYKVMEYKTAVYISASFNHDISSAAVLDGVERLTAEEMDERRQQNMAYEYLCHLEEAKR